MVGIPPKFPYPFLKLEDYSVGSWIGFNNGLKAKRREGNWNGDDEKWWKTDRDICERENMGGVYHQFK